MLRALVIFTLLLVNSNFVRAQCPGNPLGDGDHEIEVRYDGRTRVYTVHVSRGIPSNQAMPLIVAMHGYTDSPGGIELYSGFSRRADELRNYIVVYPQGEYASWNAGKCCGTAMSLDIDDFGFIRFLIGDIQNRVCIDPKRVYVTGMSNGCFMSQGLVCKAPDLIAASGCHSGGEILTTNCDREFETFNKTVNVLEIHGTSDSLVPYDGNILFPSVEDNFAAHVKRMGCTTGPRTTYDQGVYSCEHFTNCVGGVTVEQCTARGRGHTWFSDRDFDSTDYLLTFFGLL